MGQIVSWRILSWVKAIFCEVNNISSLYISSQRRLLYQYDHLFWSWVIEADEEKSFSELSQSQFFLKSWCRKCEISLLKNCKKIVKIFSTLYPNTSVHLARRICSWTSSSSLALPLLRASLWHQQWRVHFFNENFFKPIYILGSDTTSLRQHLTQDNGKGDGPV